MDRRIADTRKGGGRGGELMRGVVLMIGAVQCAGLLFFAFFFFFLWAERRIYLCRGDSARGIYTPVTPQVLARFQSWFSPRILQGISIGKRLRGINREECGTGVDVVVVCRGARRGQI